MYFEIINNNTSLSVILEQAYKFLFKYIKFVSVKWANEFLKLNFFNNSNINLNKMEYTNCLTKYLLSQGILDEKSKDEFTNSYYSQEENQDSNESQLFENTAVFTLAWFMKI